MYKIGDCSYKLNSDKGVVATNKIQTGIRFTQDMLYKITFIAKRNHR